MSEYAEIVPGLWTVRCVDYKAGECAGPAMGGEPGVFICEAHARLRGLLPGPGSGSEPPVISPGEGSGQVAEQPTSVSAETTLPLEPTGGA